MSDAGMTVDGDFDAPPVATYDERGGGAGGGGAESGNFALPSFNKALGNASSGAIDLLKDVDLNVKIELGRTKMLIEDVLRLGEGSVVELDKLAGDPVDVFVNDQLVRAAKSSSSTTISASASTKSSPTPRNKITVRASSLQKALRNFQACLSVTSGQSQGLLRWNRKATYRRSAFTKEVDHGWS